MEPSSANWPSTVGASGEGSTGRYSESLSPVAAPGDGRLFAYRRDSRNGDEHLLVALNPGLDEESFELPGHAEAPRALLSEGTVDVGSGRVRMGAQSFAVIAL